MEQEPLNEVEKLTVAHQKAARIWSDRWDDRAGAMQRWAKLKCSGRPVDGALAELKKADADCEAARAELVRIDSALSEARHRFGWQAREAMLRRQEATK